MIDTELIHRGQWPTADVANLISLAHIGGTLAHTLKLQFFKDVWSVNDG